MDLGQTATHVARRGEVNLPDLADQGVALAMRGIPVFPCARCGFAKPLSDFRLRKDRGRRYTQCRSCERAQQLIRNHRVRNRTKVCKGCGMERSADYYYIGSARCKECVRLKYRTLDEYRRACAARAKKYQTSPKGIATRYAYLHSEKGIISRKKYKASFGGRIVNQLSRSLRRARERLTSLGKKISRTTILTIYTQQQRRCAICRHLLRLHFEIDHIIPLAVGGEHRARNIQLTCLSCNRQKGAKDPIEFMRGLGRLL
jgi:5-methylcytosine-specific restriction endonuclease McrA